MFDKNFGRVVLTLLLMAGVAAVGAAALGAWGAYALAIHLGASKGLAIAAAVGGAAAAPGMGYGGFKGTKKLMRWNKKRKWQQQMQQNYQQPATYAPPVSAPVPRPETTPDGTPTIFVDAMEKLEEMKPEERKKYLETLRDKFPNEVDTLHGYDEKMALKQPLKPAKKITLAQK
jgi:hypothetical protein